MSEYTRVSNPAKITDIMEFFNKNGFDKPLPKQLITYDSKNYTDVITKRCKNTWIPINLPSNCVSNNKQPRGVKISYEFRNCRTCKKQLTLYNVHNKHGLHKCELCNHSCKKIWICIYCKYK
jgi:hypothetical protein